MKNIFKYFTIIFIFVFGMFLASNEAKAYVFYYNSRDAVGLNYANNGYVSDVKDQIIIYGHDVKAGYTVGYSTSQIRIKKITMKVGNSNETEITSYGKDNLGANTVLEPGYAISTTGSRSATDKITINLQTILDSQFSGYTSSNDISIKIYLEKKGFCLFGCNWDDYNSISYKNTDGTATNSINIKRTNNSLFGVKIKEKTTGTLVYPSSNKTGNEIYYNRGSTKSNYYYQVKTSFKLKSASSSVTYVEMSGASNTTSTTTHTNYSEYSQGNISVSSLLVNDTYNKYTFASYTITATDLYGITTTQTVDNTDVVLTVATKTPKIDSVILSVTDDAEILYGAVDVYAKFDLSSLDYTNNSYTYEITSVTFNVGSGSVTKTCNNCKGSVLSNNKNVQQNFMLYSNEGVGEVTFKNVVAKVTDKYGNSKSYAATTSLTSSVERTITLASNSAGSEFKSTYNHYYDGEIIHFSLTLKGRAGTSIDSISLIDSSDNSYVIYNQKLTKDVEGSYKYDLSSDAIRYDNTTTWVGIKLNNFCNTNNPDEPCENPVIDAVLYFNYYKTLSTDASVTNNSSISVTSINSSSVNITNANINVSNSGNANVKFSSCEYVSGDDPYIRCPYSNLGADGFALVSLERGTFVFASGQKNEKTTIKVIENRANPSVTVTPLSGDGTYYDSANKAYYYKGNKALTIALSDGYCGSGSFYYSFASTYEKIDFSCGANNELTASTATIPLPDTDGVYEFDFYVVSDGIAKNEQTYQDKFVARNNFFLDGAIIKINNDPFFLNNYEGYYNDIVVKVEGVTANSIISKYRMHFSQDLSYTESTLTIGNSTYSYNSTNRGDLVGLNGTPISFTITLIDKLGNTKAYPYSVNVDTLAPVNPDPRTTVSGSEYLVTISNFDEYDEGDVITIKYGEVEDTCVKEGNNTCTFTINNFVYELQAHDKANNTSALNRYTAEKTNANVSGAYLSIAPFLNGIYSITDDVTIRAYKYLYTDGEIASPNTINRACTSVTTYNCYITYRLTSTSMYEASELAQNELNVKISSLRLESNYTYVFLVTLGNSSLALVNDYDEYPRLDIEYIDTMGPQLIVPSINDNPRVVSDATTNENTYTFEFTVKDNNIDTSVGYEYLILNKSYAPASAPHTLNNTRFMEYIAYCPRNWSDFADACGQWSSEIINYNSASGDMATGIISIAKNGTMKNNTLYLLYVKVYDKNGNFDIITLNEFRNLSSSIEVYYKDGEAGSETLATTNSIKTTYDNASFRVALNSALTGLGHEVDSVKLDGEVINKNNNHRVGSGIYELEIKDTLGNVRVLTIYCGALTPPEIKIYNHYDGEYYEIKADGNYAYNAATLANLYVKVVATNLQNVGVRDEGSDKDTVYASNTAVYNAVTNADGTNPYGMQLATLLGTTSGTVTISAANDGGLSSIDLEIDSDTPLIQILSGVINETTVYLFGEAHTLSFDTQTNKYSLTEANYRYELNYEYLFNALSMKIDGLTFENIKESSNVIVKKDGVRIENYRTPIATNDGGSEVSIEYFDMAGNIAIPLYINLEIVDKEAPEFIDFNLERTVEANADVLYMEEITSTSDNFDPLSDISIRVSLNGTQVYDDKFVAFKTIMHKFNAVGEYSLTFVLYDTNGNVSDVYTQVVTAIDTTAPTTSDTIELDSMDLGKETIINLPRYVDSDLENTVYYPRVVELYKDGILVNDSFYNLVIEDTTASVTFNQNATLGTYVILFKVEDIYGNVATIQDNFTLTDKTPPVIRVYLNGKEITEDTFTLVYGDTTSVIQWEAVDAHDGIVSVSQTGNRPNANVQGNYKMILTARDRSGIIATREITVVVEADNIAPVINKVSIGRTTLIPSNESLPIYNSLNYKYEIIRVEASDNSRVDYVKINYGGVEAGNGSEVRLVDGSLVVMVEVADTSGNKTNATYYVSVDNSAPVISGVENYKVYDAALNVSAKDTRGNLLQVEVYKGESVIKEFVADAGVDVFNMELTEVGKYIVIATDTYDNETRYVFEIKEKASHSIKDLDGNKEEYNNDGTFLSKVEVGANDSLTIYFTKNNLIKDNDQVYILVNYPNSDDMYVAYSTNGAYYNSHEKVILTGSVITGASNASTLENIGNAQYAYVMVVKAASGVEDDTSNTNTQTSTGMSKGVKDALTILGVCLFVTIVIVIFVKFRRKIRAA